MKQVSKKIVICVILPMFFFHSIPTFRSTAKTIQKQLQKVTTKKPIRYGEPFTIHYSIPPTGFQDFLKNPKELRLLINKNPFDPLETVAMEKINGTWTTSITITDTSVKMILFAFQAVDSLGLRSSRLIDDNDGDFWDILIEDSTRTPVQGAHQARALSYTGLGGNRREDLDIALKEIKEELSLYPDNYSARTLIYNILLRQYEFSKAIRSRIEREIDLILVEHPDEETVMNYALESYRMIGQTNKARKIENALIQRNPKGDQAAMKAFDEIMKLEDTGIRVERLERFLSEFPDTRWVEFALSNLASATIELEDSTKMVTIGDRLLEKSTSPAAASALAGIAGVLSEKQTEIDRAVAYAKRALTIIRSTQSSTKPTEISDQEWNEQLRTTEARYRDILGWAYLQQDKVIQGLSELREAVKGTSQPGVYYHLAAALQKTGDIDEALVNYGKATAFGGEIGDMAYNVFYDLWIQSQKNPDEMDAFLDEQAEWIEENYRKRVLSQRSVWSAPDFELQDLAGGWVRLSDQKGNIILLCFWASWSKSSGLLLQELQNLADSYGKDVLFLTIATDVELITIEEFVNKKQFHLPVLLNEETDQDYGLQGVPTLFVIDAEGSIHFEHKGYRPDIKEILKIELEDLL